jgi:acetyl-CoA carboxylase carboxyltransferase component
MTLVAEPVGERLRPVDQLTQLFDAGTMQVIRSLVAPAVSTMTGILGDGVLGAAGTVAGRPVYAYAYDGEHAAGAMGVVGASTIVRVLDLAERAGAPVVAYIASAGARLQEGTAALGGFGLVFREIVRLRHRVPQIAVITGTSAGGGAYAPALMDWIIMVKGSAMFLTGPAVLRQAIGEQADMEQLGGVRVHSASGVAHLVADDPAHATRQVIELLGLLPQCAGAPAPLAPVRAPAREIDPGLLVPRAARKVYDVRGVVAAIVDDGRLLELSARRAPNILTAFCRLGGRVIGVLANQPRFRGGVIDVASSRKGAEFIDSCNAYGIPLVVLVDTAGFMPGTRQEGMGIIRTGAELIRAFAGATVPRITVVLRKAYGGAYITMNSKELGAQFVFAWPHAEIGVMAARSAAVIMERSTYHPDTASRDGAVDKRAAAYALQHISAASAAGAGLVDEVIESADTRARLCWALSVLAGWRTEIERRAQR